MSEPYTSRHIYHITDTFDTRARGKIDGAYTKYRAQLGLRDTGYSFVPALNTVDIGISVSEFASNTQRPDRLIFAVNCAPPDKKEGTKDNARNDFFGAVVGDHTDHIIVCGTSNGYEFSYLKPHIKALYRFTNTNSLKSQFRSLEILPQHALLFSNPHHRARLVTSGVLENVENIDDIVPSVPNVTHVYEVDNFSNVKLFPSCGDLALLRDLEGKVIRFSFSDTSVETSARPIKATIDYDGLVASTLFAAPLQTNVVALRSSSRLLGSDESCIPIIATIRPNPAETEPNYDVPSIGRRVILAPSLQNLAAA